MTSRVAPHCPLGPIALAACLQLDAVCYNAFIQEQSLGIHYNTANDLLDYVATIDRLRLRRWLCRHSGGPGPGHRDRRGGRRADGAQEGHRWRNPVWRHKDGTFAEW